MFARLNRTHVQAFLELSALAGSMGFNLRGAYPAKAVFVEQYYKPTVVQRASETIPRVVQGKPKTLYIGSDTMVRPSSPAPLKWAAAIFGWLQPSSASFSQLHAFHIYGAI